MKRTAILIDDERKALSILRSKIERFCPVIEIIAETQDPREGVILLENEKPDIVFLDVAMPEMSGFDILKQITNPSFELIFVTAFDDYAIDAIKNCAIGYLVKPIDNNELKNTVDKAIKNIDNKNTLKQNKTLIENLDVISFQEKKLIIPNQEGLLFVKINDILHCEGDQGYTNIYLEGKQKIISSKNIGYFKKILKCPYFYPVHKSHLINLNYVEKYTNEGYVILNNKAAVPVSRNKRSDFIDFLKKGLS